MFTCFSDLSRAELAHVRRCQSIAQAEGLSVVSSGVLAAPAAGAPAGAHFWLVGSPTSGAVSFVWLSAGPAAGGAGGRRLFCGCPRRRGPAGALTCAHAQCVRFWLLAAAGVAVPPLPVPPLGGAALPVPVAAPAAASVRLVSGVRRIVSSLPCYDLAPPVVAPRWLGPCARGVVLASSVDDVRLSVRLAPVSSRLRLGRRLRLGLRLSRRCSAVPRGALVGASAPAPVVADPARPLGRCPACERPAPRDVLGAFGVCAECLDLMALAESAPPVRRCADCRAPAIGEDANGMWCGPCLARRRAEFPFTQRDADLLGVAMPDGETEPETEPELETATC